MRETRKEGIYEMRRVGIKEDKKRIGRRRRRGKMKEGKKDNKKGGMVKEGEQEGRDLGSKESRIKGG
jgi:hypothetical protein